MRIIGITGGVGSGKSRVLCYLQEQFQAVVCQLDEVAKELQKRGQPCFARIVEQFGTAAVGQDGELDRQELGRIVFGDRERLEALNRIVHPEVKRKVREEILRRKQEGVPLFIIEAALLPTAGYEDICGEMWYIYAEESLRARRLKESRGYSDSQISRMMAAQPDEEVFRRFCTVVIDNSKTFEYTKEQIGELL